MEQAMNYGNEIKTLVEEMKATYKRKNHDYGNSFDQSLDEDGLIAAKVRIGDKIRRFTTLIGKERQVADESTVDTLKDLSTYCVMAMVWRLAEDQTVDSIFDELVDYVERYKEEMDDSLSKFGVVYSAVELSNLLKDLGKEIKKEDKTVCCKDCVILYNMAEIAISTVLFINGTIIPKEKETSERAIYMRSDRGYNQFFLAITEMLRKGK